jgi:hypothetical protein
MPSIDTIINQLDGIMNFNDTPSQSIAPPLRLLSPQRSGMSNTKTLNKVLKRMSDIGIPIGTLEDGSPNLNSQFVQIIIEEIFNAIKYDSKIELAVKPFGSVTVTGVAGPGLPVVGTGVMTTIQEGGVTIQ